MSDDTDALVTELGDAFASATTQANGITLHYVHGGTGPTVLLVHGFPQDWYEWRSVMPRLAERYHVVAVDLRGTGGSDAPRGGYDAPTLADDLAALVEGLDLGPVHLVGHDIGGWVGYAFALRRPDLVATAVIVETLLPGIDPPAAPPVTVPLWHGGFHQVPDLPETLVQDRQAPYFRYFLEIGTADRIVTDAEVAHYAAAYGDLAHLRAAFEVYRAIPWTAEFNHAADGADVPLLLVGGEQVFGPAMAALAEHLQAEHGWTDVDSVTLPGARHYLPEDRPEDIAELVTRHARQRGPQARSGW